MTPALRLLGRCGPRGCTEPPTLLPAFGRPFGERTTPFGGAAVPAL